MFSFNGKYECHHGIIGQCDECDIEDDEINERGGIDKCLNCGKYMYNDQLDRNQVCLIRCRNPNEY